MRFLNVGKTYSIFYVFLIPCQGCPCYLHYADQEPSGLHARARFRGYRANTTPALYANRAKAEQPLHLDALNCKVMIMQSQSNGEEYTNYITNEDLKTQFTSDNTKEIRRQRCCTINFDHGHIKLTVSSMFPRLAYRSSVLRATLHG